MDESHTVWKYQQGQKKLDKLERARQRREDKETRDRSRQTKKVRKADTKIGGATSGRVAEVQRSRVLVMHDDVSLPCRLPGGHTWAGRLVVGDGVTFDEGADGVGIIRDVLPRESKLVRLRMDYKRQAGPAGEEQVLAANVNVAVIVVSAESPPFHPRLIDRYLVMCQYGGIDPVICMNKCDLVDSSPDLATYEAMGVPVVCVSAETGQGIGELLGRLEGKYSVFTGHSGVGKSSLINRLLGQEMLRSGDVSDRSARGRHTTTASTLLRLGSLTYVIDTPGIRMLGLWRVDPQTARLYFPEFENPARACRFRDCRHVDETECGVKEAVEHGEVSTDRYDSYLRILQDWK